jgi:hypothetical protein
MQLGCSFVISIVTIGFALPVASGQTAEVKPKSVINVSTREDLRAAIESAKPGTRIQIAPGTYQGGLRFVGLEGAKDQPIVIAALEESNPPVFKGGASCFHFARPKHVELSHLVLTEAAANGLNIDDGGTEDNPASHVVLRNLQVRDVGPRGNRDGIKLSGLDNFRVEGCTIERWGNSGSAIDMVGCHDGKVVSCTFRHRGDLPANGVQSKGGSARVSIQRCRFENAGGRAVNIGGSTGRDHFRPGGAGYEAQDITVEDCTFIGSMAPVVFVGVDGAVVRYNTIYRPTRWIVRILQESQGQEFVPCRNGSFTNNIVAFRSNEVQTPINIGGGTAPETFKFTKNAWYCIDNPRLSSRLDLPVKETEGKYGQDPKFRNENEHDLRLEENSPVSGTGVRLTETTDPKPKS